MITHYDLFAGIGGFSLALEEVFENEPIKHIFCEWEQFPTAVLKQHWPNGEFWGDIADLVTHTGSAGLEEARSGQQTKGSGRSSKPVTYTEQPRLERGKQEAERYGRQSDRERSDQTQDWSIVTGGFPCQPFSAAGRRRGTADDRYKWPEMFAVIRNVKPTWVIAENVRGLVTWNDGMVLEQVCTDLESEGYEVQPFVIPAVAVNAPHRRDRVWIIAHANSERITTGHREVQETDGKVPERHDNAKSGDTVEPAATDTRPQRRQPRSKESLQSARQEPSRQEHEYPDWSRNWQEVARGTSSSFIATDYSEGELDDDGEPVGTVVSEVPFTTRNDAMDDGLPRLVDGVSTSRARWRRDSLKAYGNGIVPQVAMEILRSIKYAQELTPQ